MSETQSNSVSAVMPAQLPPGPAERTVYSYGVRAGDQLYISGMVALILTRILSAKGTLRRRLNKSLRTCKQ